MPKPVAAFDVDGTLFKSSLVEKFIEEAVSKRLFRAASFGQVYEARDRWQNTNNEGLYQSYLAHLIASFVLSMEGVEVERFTRVTSSMIERQRVRRFAFPRLLITARRDSHYLVAISGSPLLLVKPFLADLNFNDVYGSTFMQNDGVFTGEASAVGDKSEILKRLKKDGAITLGSGSTAIGDTASDIPLLECVEHPIVFNGSKTLTRLAREKDKRWLRVNEVKDMITVLKPFTVGEGKVAKQEYREVSVVNIL